MEKTSGARIRDFLDKRANACLDRVDVFSELASTNTYLLEQPAPRSGRCRVALADHQTAGRGRLGRVWHSPRLSGLYMSVAYTFGSLTHNVSCFTLAAGIAVARALESLGVSDIRLKWPNDLVLLNAKLGGILTEIQSDTRQSGTVVTGIGINLHMGGQLGGVTSNIGRIAALGQVIAGEPDRMELAAAIIAQLIPASIQFETDGFAPFYRRWRQYDWLQGKAVRVTVAGGATEGVARGIDEEGALLIDQAGTIKRVVSGSVSLGSAGGCTQ